MSSEVELVDIGGGNIGSVSRCLERLGINFKTVNGAVPPSGDRPVVVPGVGAFGAVMESLRRSGLDNRLVELVRGGTPYLGICVGMQVLFEESEESRGSKGLGLVAGKVVRYQHEKVPQIGWNKLIPKAPGWNEGFAYFVNSYYPQPAQPEVTLFEAEYAGRFCAAIKQDNITAFQFHPEKSSQYGSELLTRWLASVS